MNTALINRVRLGFFPALSSLLLAVAAVVSVHGADSDKIITTFAGTGSSIDSGDGGPAKSAGLAQPFALAVDANGNVYVAEYDNNVVRKITPTGIISIFAGTSVRGYSGDGGPASAARLNQPHGLAVDGSGNVYVMDTSNHCIRKVNPAGTISTIAGICGQNGYSGDGGPATVALLNGPIGAAFDTAGSLYVADFYNNRIRKITPAGTISTIAGSGTPGYSGDGGPATAAHLYNPEGITLDAVGNIYFTDQSNNRIRKINSSGLISTIAGSGATGQYNGAYSGDGGPATAARLSFPIGIAVDGAGNVYVADANNNRVRMITPSGIISTIAGNGIAGSSGDSGPATAAQLDGPVGLALDASGNLYVAEQLGNRIRKISAAACPTTPSYNPSTNALHLPTVDVPNAAGSSPLVYTMDLNLVSSNPAILQVASFKQNSCSAAAGDSAYNPLASTLHIPSLTLTDPKGNTSSNLSLDFVVTNFSPMQFQLIGVAVAK